MAKQRAFANQEREFQAQRAGKIGRAALMSMATLFSFAAFALLAADQLYRPDTFIISELKIKGKFRHLDPATIEAALAEQDLGNFFSIELAAIKAKVEALPWVQSVDVRRAWPNTLELVLTEHRPVMRWGKDKWVSSAGVVVDIPDSLGLKNTITLKGDEQDAATMLQAAVAWKKRLQANGLELKVVELSGSRAWTLQLRYPEHDADFEVLLGREDVGERLARFQYLFAKQFKHVDQKLQRVDARYPDGLAVRAEKMTPNDATTSNSDVVATSN